LVEFVEFEDVWMVELFKHLDFGDKFLLLFNAGEPALADHLHSANSLTFTVRDLPHLREGANAQDSLFIKTNV
jgi:hypothetical protein